MPSLFRASTVNFGINEFTRPQILVETKDEIPVQPLLNPTENQRPKVRSTMARMLAVFGSDWKGYPAFARNAKLAFEVIPEDIVTSDKRKFQRELLRTQIALIIRKEMSRKHEVKAALENEKEIKIKSASSLYESLYAQSSSEREREKLRRDEIIENKKTLHHYRNEVNNKSGWEWQRIIKAIREELDEVVIIKAIGPKTLQIYIDNHPLFSIYFDDARFRDTPDQQQDFGTINPKFTKRGYENIEDPTVRCRKEYVRDKRGIFTKRYASRICNVEQMQELLHGSGLIRPRNTETALGEQVNVFNAVMSTSRNSDHVQRTEATRQTELTDNELEFLHVRDGSGPNQRFLSVTSVQTPKKVLRGNQGKRFDEQNDSAALLKMDLTKIPQDDIRNQYANEAHQYKVAYARYSSQWEGKLKGIKRSAKGELEECIYTVQKNREILLKQIPANAVVGVKLCGSSNWMNIATARNIIPNNVVNLVNQKEDQ